MKRTSLALLLAGLLLAGLATVPPAGHAAATKSALKSRFNGAVSAAKAGKYAKYCSYFTKARIKKFGGTKACGKALKENEKKYGLRAKAKKLKVTGTAVSGSTGTVRWTSGSLSQLSTLKYQSGKWRLDVFLAG